MAAIPFRNAVVVMTGGASGLGKALCEELGRRGAFVVVADVQEEGARAVAAGIAAAGGRASAAALDGRGAAAVGRLVGGTNAPHGRAGHLFNNPRLPPPRGAQNPPLPPRRR